MTWFSGDENLSLLQIADIYDAGDMGKLIHKELQLNLAVRENELVRAETEELVRENHNKHGGSSLGFYYGGELFAVAPTFKKQGVTPINTELEHKANMLRANRVDIPQYMTYFAHYLTTLENSTDDPVVYIANIPRGLSTFSDSLRKLESRVEQKAPDRMISEAYSREDSTRAVFYLHYDRINRPLKRFLFRRITS